MNGPLEPAPLPALESPGGPATCPPPSGPAQPGGLPFPRAYGKEQAIHGLLFLASTVAIVSVLFILAYIFSQALPIFPVAGVWEFLTGAEWNPTGVPPLYGTLALVVGTILVTLGAMVIAIPLSLGCAIFTAEIASSRVEGILKPAIELLAGIPSVVYGFFGLVILTEALRVTFDLASGLTWLAGSILLAIMTLPTITSVSEDALRAVPRELREGSLALGATKWQTVSRVVVPSALSGITAAVILGIGRAVGETMAVLMVCGNAAIIPSPIWNVFSPIRTLTATLGIETGEVAAGSDHYAALFGVALLLLVITLLVNMAAAWIIGRIQGGQVPAAPRQEGGAAPPWRRAAGAVGGIATAARRPAAVLLGCLAILAVDLALGHGAALAVLGAVTAYYLLKPRISPGITERFAFFLMAVATGIVLIVLGVILWDIIVHGLPAISWEFLTGYPRNLGRGGGIYPAIVGTLYLVAGAMLLALPVGICAAIYLVEYNREGRLVRLVRTGVDLLNGTPSIVFGLFGFAFLVIALDLGVSLIAGQVTLALMVLPTIIRTTEEALKSVPQGLREGSLALGATKWQTVSRVVVPPAMPGVLTGAILAVGRAAGETAPIMFTAVVFSQRFLPSSLLDPVMALPYHLYILATNVPGATTNQYGTALVLLTLVVGIYSIAIILRSHFRRTVRW
ncbi:MAG: phosphate ABC transporter permease PstA [Methanomicrobiales archaeon]|nr:phosphate ABC transporter permease PstA [Methanomicrobiales archaeon]MDD1654862.1 phosphate ABC transporter permease PstA [Methanomicrobiales archaeon]